MFKWLLIKKRENKMLYEQIRWKKLSPDELVEVIRQAQLQLGKHGVITKCKNVKPGKPSRGVKIELLAGYTNDQKLITKMK